MPCLHGWLGSRALWRRRGGGGGGGGHGRRRPRAIHGQRNRRVRIPKQYILYLPWVFEGFQRPLTTYGNVARLTAAFPPFPTRKTATQRKRDISEGLLSFPPWPLWGLGKMIAWPFRGEKEDPFLLLLLLPKENTVGSPSPQHTKEERKGKRLVLLLLLLLLCPGLGPMGFGRNSVPRGSHSTRPQRFCILHIGIENICRAQKHVVFN